MSYNKTENDIDKLRKALSDLKLLVSDQLSSQVQINCEMRARLETLEARCGGLNALNRKLKLLADKYREQKGAMDLLVQLLRGKWEERECECGRKIRDLLVEERATNRDNVAEDNKNIEMRQKSSSEINIMTPTNLKDKEITKSEENSTKNDKCVEMREKSASEIHYLTPTLLEDHKITEMREKSYSEPVYMKDVGTVCKPLLSPVRFMYTEKQLETIDKKLSGHWSRFGRVDRLNDVGEWTFKLDDGFADLWNTIVERRGKTLMFNRPVQLYNELSGLIVMIAISVNYSSDSEFRIRLFAPKCDENSSINLPITLRVQLKISLINGNKRLTEVKALTINKLTGIVNIRGSEVQIQKTTFAEPDNFYCSHEGTDRSRLPKLIFKFSLN